MMPSVRIQADDLRAFITKLFHRLGMPEDDANTAAEVLVRAGLRGVMTHGIHNLNRIYVEQLRTGEANPRPQIRMVRESPITAL